MLEAVVASDFHLCGLDKHFIDADDRILAEMDKVYQYAVKNGIKYVIMPGDLSDSPDMGWDTYSKLFLFFKKYDGIIHSIYIAGNHDFGDIENTSMNFLHTLSKHKALKTLSIYLKPERVVLEGVPCNFLPFPCLKTLSKSEGAVNFAHVEYSGAIGDNGRTLKTKQELETHPNDFTVSGHIHQYQFLEKKRAVYCGNPFHKNFGESLPEGFSHIKAKMKGKTVDFKHTFIENKPNFTLVNLHIEDINDFRKLKNDDSIRYKLHVADGIVIPPDLLIQYPNITGGIWLNGKKASGAEHEIEEKVLADSHIDLKTGLKDFLVSNGFDK